MNRIIFVSVFALLLAACGGGGSDSSDVPSYGGGDTLEDQANDYVDELADALVLNLQGSVDSSLNGVWVRVLGAVFDYEQTINSVYSEGTSKDIGFIVMTLSVSGSIVTISYCDGSSGGQMQLLQNGDVMIDFGSGDVVGTVTNNTSIDFGTSIISAMSQPGDTNEWQIDGTRYDRWVKISSNPDAVIGSMSGDLGGAPIECAAYENSEFTMNGDEFEEFKFYLRDVNDTIYQYDDTTPNSSAPVYNNDTYSAVINGDSLTFTFE